MKLTTTSNGGYGKRGMMSEIEKMYENAGVEKITLDYPDNFEPFYPEFTAEKQLKLLLFQINKGIKLEFKNESKIEKIPIDALTDSIAGLINNIWQDLTEEDKTSIKNILEM